MSDAAAQIATPIPKMATRFAEAHGYLHCLIAAETTVGNVASSLVTPQEITRAREDLGLTQRALAEHLGVAPNTVWRWESGKTAPSPQYMQVFEAMMERPEDGFKAALQAWLLPTDLVTVEAAGADRVDLIDEGPAIPMVMVRIKRTYAMLMPVSPAAIADPDAHQSMADHIARRFNESFRAAMEQTPWDED